MSKFKKTAATLMASALALSLAACSSGNDEGKETGGNTDAGVKEEKIVFGTGGTSGTYYPIGGALKPLWEESDYIKSVTVEATGASVANIQNINDGLNQVGIVMSDVVYDALNGEGSFEGAPVEVKALAGLYPNVVQVVATKESGVTSIEDLKGKRVGVGQVGSGVEQSAAKTIEAAGLSYEDLSQVTHTGYADSVQAMKNGNLDAAFFTSGVPNSNITDLQQANDIVFVNIDGEVANTLLERYPFYETYDIPTGDAAKYNLETGVSTIAIKNMIIVSKDLSEDAVYEMTKKLYDYLGTDAVSVGSLKAMDRDNGGKDLIAPLHPGAEKFYKEIGILE